MAYEAKFVIAAENRVKEATDAAQKDFEGFGGKVKEALSTITVTAGDVMNAIKGVSSTVTEWINAYAEDERALITLKTALEATGQASGNAVGKLTSFASSLQAVTGIGDEATNALSARLIASGLSVEQTMKLIKAAADYSAATGEDFNSTVDNLQRTLSGTAGRISGFIPELKDLSKEQLQSGAAIDVVAEKYGGFAEKLVGTASVSLETFNAAWGDVKEALGGAIMPAIQPVLEEFTKFLTNTVIPAIQGFGPIVKEIFGQVEELIIAFKPIVEPVLNWFADIWKTTIGPNINTVWDIVKNVIQLITAAISGDWSKAWESAKKIVNDAIDIIQRAFTPLTKAATTVWDGVKTAWTTVWDTLKNIVKNVVDAIAGFFKPIVDTVNTVLGGIEKALQFVSGEKRVGNYLVDKNNKIIGEYIIKNGVEVLRRYASGTTSAEPGLAIVGEKGPELMLLKGGEQIIPNNLLPDNLNIRGYANGTSGWVDTTVQSAIGKYLNVGATELGNLSSVLGNTLSTLINSLGIFGNMIMGMNPVLAILEPVLQGFVQIIGPAITAVIQPVMNVLMQFGQLIAQALLPIFDALAPILAVVAQLMQNNLAPIISIVARVAAVLAGVFYKLTPVIVLVAKALTILTSPVEFLADLFNWVGGVINAFGANVGIALWNITHPFNQKGFVSGPGAFSSDAFSGLADRLAAIDELAANTGAISSSVSTTTAAQSAQYRSQSITINIYQQSPVVGDNGMRQFAAMIRTEFEALAYYGT